MRTADGEPHSFGQKIYPHPHHNMVAAALGSSNLGDAWARWITTTDGLADVESLAGRAPAVLRQLRGELETYFEQTMGSATIYHYGFPSGSEKLVCYTYRSSKDFESERYEGPQFTAKPVPPDYKFDRPQNPQEVIELATRVRDLNNANMGEWGVAIGGELYATLVENGSVHTSRWHRFPDFDETARAIQQFHATREHQ